MLEAGNKYESGALTEWEKSSNTLHSHYAAKRKKKNLARFYEPSLTYFWMFAIFAFLFHFFFLRLFVFQLYSNSDDDISPIFLAFFLSFSWRSNHACTLHVCSKRTFVSEHLLPTFVTSADISKKCQPCTMEAEANPSTYRFSPHSFTTKCWNVRPWKGERRYLLEKKLKSKKKWESFEEGRYLERKKIHSSSWCPKREPAGCFKKKT